MKIIKYFGSGILFCSFVGGAATQALAAGPGDAAPKKCSASDIEYLITNVVPQGSCLTVADTIQVNFDVEIWGNPTRYNLAVGYTNAGDNILQDVSCLDTGIDIDGLGCDDYDGSGTVAAPYVAQSSFDVSCDLDGNLLVDPLVGVDFYVSFDASSGGTVAEITAPKCLLQEGNTFPTAPVALTLLKSVINDSGGSATVADWTLSATQIGGISSMSGVSGTTDNTLPAGVYSLTESGATNYTLDSISCSGAVFDAAAGTVTLEAGDSASCTFTNNDDFVATPLANLTLVKSVVNNEGGTSVPNDFQLAINGGSVLSGAVNTVNAGVNLVISEMISPSYTAGAWNCVDSTGLTSGLPTTGAANGTTVNLIAGSDVVCTIENDDIAVVTSEVVDLSVLKSASNMNPDIGELITFNLTVSNAGPDTATDVTVTDVLPSGFSYEAASISGGNSQLDGDPNGAGLQWAITSLPMGATASLSFQATVVSP